MTGMLSELQNMRQEINLIHNSSLRAKCQNLLQKTDDRIRQGFVACKKMKDNLIRSAADAMKAFREKGKDALASSVRAMKIPEVLDKVAVMFRKMSGDLAQNSVRLESMQSELRIAQIELRYIFDYLLKKYRSQQLQLMNLLIRTGQPNWMNYLRNSLAKNNYKIT